MAYERITVKSNVPDNRLALHERHPDHPDGEVMVYGDEPKEVARTPRVSRALGDELLTRVTASGKASKEDEDSAAADPPPPAEETTDATGTAKAGKK
jgi:hypothetical protein